VTTAPAERHSAADLDERGFSLVEVIVASIVAVIAVMGLAHSFGMGRALIDRHESARDALALVQQRLEFLANVSSGNPDLDFGTKGPNVIQINDAVTGNETWTVQPVDDPVNGAGNDYKRITVTISWMTAGITDQIQLSRIVLLP
jgi:prepilin-type N-terminal cleavage/methylation domain-containing protein